MNTDLHIEEFLEHGSDAGHGNLLGIQPFMVVSDYASGEAFFTKLDGYLEVAHQKGWLNERTIAIFPEYLGTWLVAAGEKPSVYQATSIAEAMRLLVLKHGFSFARNLLTAKETDKVKASLFRIKAESMRRLYQDTFSNLAKKYSVTVVAGSILLPSPQVKEGRLVVRGGLLYNTSAVYRPDGSIYPQLIRKAFPIEGELPFVASAPVDDIPAFDTPAGRLGVLVCADSWYPGPYERLKAQGVEMVAVPSYASEKDSWDKPWAGYNGAPAPDDVDPHDVGQLTEGQAWLKYALSGRIAQAGAQYGVNVFLHGELWDLGADSGNSVIVDGETVLETRGKGAAMLNLWL